MAQEIDSSAWTGRSGHRISILMAIMLIVAGILFDGIQDVALFFNVVPILGTVLDIVISWFVTFVATVVFGLWFWLLGVNYISGKYAARKALIILSSLIIELIPIVDALPAITFGVVALIIQTRMEDGGSDVKSVLKNAGTLTLMASGGAVIAGKTSLPALSASRAIQAGGSPARESYKEQRARALDLRERGLGNPRPFSGSSTGTNSAVDKQSGAM